MRKGLSIDELGDFLQRPFNATLATYRRDGSVLLSPVWHEWRDGGFSIFTGENDVKLRHIEQQGRAQVYLQNPFDGVVVIRLVPGRLRTWDFADEYESLGGPPE